MGELEGGQDRPHQTKTMATGKAVEETDLAMKHEGASLRAETAMEGW